MAALSAAATLYSGRVAHIRHAPFRHRFDYRIWMLAIDLDRTAEAANKWWFGHNRAGLISLQDRDHGDRDGTPLRGYVETALARDGLAAFGARIVFVTMPRLLGFAFSPISFYFCHDQAGRLGAVLHQVKNTFGDQIGYLMPVTGEGVIRQSAPKRMHVSPFFDMRGGYRFALTAPGENFTVSIQYGTAARKRMTATMVLRSREWSRKSLLGLLAQMPLVPLKVILAIHFQALKLFLRGAEFHAIPPQTHDAVIMGETL